MKYRLAIFDFDGTLADSFASFMHVVNDVADEFHFKRIAPHETNTLRGKSAREVMAHLGVPLWKLPLIAAAMRKRVAQHLAEVRPFDGTADMLRNLHAAGLTLAVVSSNSEANVRAVLRPASASRISHYACGVSLFGKASRFRQILRKSRCPPHEAIAIGDEIRDFEAARAAGIAFGAVAWGYTLPAALAAHQPDEMFGSVADIAGQIAQ